MNTPTRVNTGVQELWVEPRLRGFAALADARNPASSIGRIIPYEVGWKAFREGQGDVPRGRGVEPLKGVRLRVAADGRQALARRAMERDLRRRVREGLVHHTIPTSPAWARWVPYVMCGVFVAAACVATWIDPVRAAGAIPLAVVTAAIMMFLSIRPRAAVRSLSIEGRRIVIDDRDGVHATHDLAEVRAVKGNGPFVIHLASGCTITVVTHDAASRRLLQALMPPMSTAEAKVVLAQIFARLRRAMLVGFVALWVMLTYVRWLLGIRNGVQIPGQPLLSAALNSAFFVLLIGLTLELVMREGQIFRWLQARGWIRRRTTARRERVLRAGPVRG